ncbi:MAG: septal ring lytic transglycosylase RlpA family protein [Sebaldella sp.]|nr:septal ring lytic transglycosylase RlpA family protein [Sebaldella sp.]
MRKIFYILIVLLFVTSCTSVNSGGGSSSGKASWYGNEFNGRATASGEKFSSNKLTAAHRSLPFGSIIEVTNLENNKKVKVKVNDRGPFVSGRVLDLSEGAFSKIANKNEGVINVKIRVLKSGE